MKMILWQCCNKSCRYWKYFTVCFASSYLFVVISTASVLHLDLACVQTELGERSECRKQLMRAHTRTHNENSVCSHSCEVHSDGVSTVTQYSYLITWASPCLCSESDSVCVYEARLAHLLFQLFVISIVIPRMSSCMPLQSTACVCKRLW